ncbi:hypothetical protein BYT27DRAFT_7111158 [Phlegmacium glaucopus]|nr:hypothetical protein BYT27DRAFT_7111158 [Phlegmacium glaucopus]
MNHELYLPLPGEATAVFFDKVKPRKLLRFFEHLDRLYSRFGLEDEEKKKRYMETEECWKTFPEYGDSTAAYSNFKKAIMQIYPSSNTSTLYTIRDMEHLISERQRLGITTCDDLANFHTAYFSLTQWLISNGYISKHEQQRRYMRVIPQSLIPAVSTRLQITHLLHNPLLPYEVGCNF